MTSQRHFSFSFPEKVDGLIDRFVRGLFLGILSTNLILKSYNFILQKTGYAFTCAQAVSKLPLSWVIIYQSMPDGAPLRFKHLKIRQFMVGEVENGEISRPIKFPIKHT